MRSAVLTVVIAACAPDVPSVAERARAADLVDDAALEHQLLALPGTTGAHALLHRGFHEPLTGAISLASASVVITIRSDADRAAVTTAAHRLAPAATIEIAVAPPAPSPGGHAPLALIGLVVILGTAGYVAWRTRPTARA